VSYKAEKLGIHVGFVNPRYTSQKCSECKHIKRANRISQAEFKCKVCRFACSAEINAAMNIRDDYAPKEVPRREASPTGLGYWAVVNQPIVGGCARHDSLASLRPCAGGY
jgi:transposase